MTADEKIRVRQMRLEGITYAQISSSLNISENTIKSFCQRNKLPVGSIASLPDTRPDPMDNTICKQCGKRLKQNPKHKPKKFCSDICRNAWWKTHNEQVDKKAVYRFTCVFCGKAFESYGNRSRKYCDHTCYIKDRFFSEGKKAKARNDIDRRAI
jgi:IS30 family transposase